MWFWKRHQAAGHQVHQVLQDLSENFCTKTLKTFRESYSSVNPRLNVWGFSVQAPILVNVPLCILLLRFTFIFVRQTRAQWNGRLDKSVGGAGSRLFIACLWVNPRGSGDYQHMQLGINWTRPAVALELISIHQFTYVHLLIPFSM